MFNSFKYGKHDIKYIKVDDEIWFKGANVTSMLEYKCASQTINYHIADKDKMALKDILKRLGHVDNIIEKTTEPLKSIYINESGFNDLTMKSTMPEAVKIKKWVIGEVLPSIRRTGSYSISQQSSILSNQLAATLSTATTTDIVATRSAGPDTSKDGSSASEELSITYKPNMTNAMVKYKDKFNRYVAENRSFSKINIECEYDLQIRVVAFIKNFIIPQIPYCNIIPTIGELQYLDTNNDYRYLANAFGYIKGSPDFVIPLVSGKYNSLIIECKYNGARVRQEQLTVLRNYRIAGALVVVSDDYDYIVNLIKDYTSNAQLRCPICEKMMRHKQYNKHMGKAHKDVDINDYLRFDLNETVDI